VLVLGMGVNLVAAPVLPDRKTISLADVGVSISAAGFAVLLAEAFARWRTIWRLRGFAAIRGEWMARAHPVGTRLWVMSGNGRIEGSFADLEADGALLLDGEDGKAHRIHAGDVWQKAPAEGEGKA
jgi:BirA family transcriptional regulator, biotin operon repressor / biotin---[acetyl-CoA-carboxylase] ligase